MLGPLEVWSEEDGWTSVSAGKWRSLLACLLLRPGQVVSTGSLIEELWGEEPPPTANNLVSIYVHRLRRLIGDSEGRVIVYRKPGYQLRIDGDDTDFGRFEALTADARAALAREDTEVAAAVLAEAEGLWQGSFLADVSPTVLVATEAERALELRLMATELRIGADLARGRHAEVVPELRSLVAEHSLREGLWLLLMRALDGAGRHAEALDTYGQARAAISEELGVDPGPELQQLYAELLAADATPRVPPQREQPAPSKAPTPEQQRPVVGPGGVPGQTGEVTSRSGTARNGSHSGKDKTTGEAQGTITLGEFSADTKTAASSDGPAGTAAAEGPSALADAADSPLPQLAQLPMDIGDFTGRTEEVRHLNDMLIPGGAASGPGAVRIVVIAGTAGLGKTTLAVHAAHQVKEQFPDGQLYVDLSGASATPAEPGEVLARFLRDLGVDGDKIPASDEERAALYRTRLTGRRVLILLDNARDAAQLRPLLPGTSSCAVLVTTRNGALALASTRFVDLNTLSDPEALELFINLVGDERPTAEPDATAEILLACAGLPLAIRICAARLASRRQWNVATLASRLRDSRHRLDELHAGDLEVRASFQVSYDALKTTRYRLDPARAFRLLGLWEGRAISLPAATALIGGREADVADALERLVDANLLDSPAPDRYQFHDLLRVYATERAEAEEAEADRAIVMERLFRWYLSTAETAANLVSPHRYRTMAGEDTTPNESLTSLGEALDWYENERGNLVVATRQAAALGFHDIAWRLGTALFSLFNRSSNWTDCITVNRIALEAARHVANRHGESWAMHGLGHALARIGDGDGLGHIEKALGIRQEIGDRDGEAQSAISLADAYYRLRGPGVAFAHSLRCLEILREVGKPAPLGSGLINHGVFCLELGRLEEAAACFSEALSIWRGIGAYGQGYALHNLGRVYLESNRLDDAIASLTEAHRLHLSSGDLLGQAMTLKYLGHAQRAQRNEEQARESWKAALVIFENLQDDAEVEEIHSILAM